MAVYMFPGVKYKCLSKWTLTFICDLRIHIECVDHQMSLNGHNIFYLLFNFEYVRVICY